MNFILHADPGGYDLGAFHPILVHFPIVLFTATLVCDLLYGIGKRGALIVGHWMLFCGVIMAAPTIFTGLEASESFPAVDPIVFRHKLFAIGTVSYAVLYSILRIIAIRRHGELPSLVFVILSVVLVGLTSKTADYGGILSHGSTPFSRGIETSHEEKGYSG